MSTAGDERRSRITVIDDEEGIVYSIRDFLEPRGFDISVAFDGQSGLEVIRNEHPDMVIMDIMMPGIDGRDLMLEMKTDDDLKNIPVVFLSAKDEPFEVEYGKELGAVGYLTKPYQSRHLMAQIKSILKL